MSKVHLITGYKGEEHIQSADQGSFNASFFGGGEYVMEAGNQFEASIMDNNTVRILDGDLLMQGRHIRIEPETYEDMTITTGTAGANRIDLIVMQYSKDTSTDIEDAKLVVIKGTETEGTATDPEYTSGDILSGATFNQMPLYRVKVEGVVLIAIEPLFTVIPTYKTLAEQYAKKYEDTINKLKTDNILDTMSEIEANTQEGQIAGALALKEFGTARNVNTYYSLSQLGLSFDNTIKEVMRALPINSELIQNTSQISNNFTLNLPNGAEAGEVRFCKGGANQRGIVEFKSYASDRVYVNRFYDNVFKGWRKLIEPSDLTDFIKTMEVTGPSTTIGAEGSSTMAKTVNFTYTVPDGYTAIGIAGFHTGDTEVYAISATTKRMDLRNKNTVSVTVTPTLKVLLAKIF